MQGRTRLGKVVGSIRTDPQGFTYWAERNWTTQEDGFMVIAPSGARMSWHKSEADAQRRVVEENREWFAL